MSDPAIKEDPVTKDYLAAQLAALELRLTQRLMELAQQGMATERSLRQSIDNTRNLIFGTYALMIAAVFINHFWR